MLMVNLCLIIQSRRDNCNAVEKKTFYFMLHDKFSLLKSEIIFKVTLIVNT